MNKNPLAILLLLCGTVLVAKQAIASEDFVINGLAGDVTTNEYKAFLVKLRELPPPPSNNIGNTLVYERIGGASLHGMQTFYSFTHNREVLDKAVEWSDAFLHARNDPVTGRVVWTGKRELCWPNKGNNDTEHVLYSGTENGDVIEHIVATAKLILEDSSLWNQTAPPDHYSFGATYLDRAKTYVRECQRSAETTIVPWYVRSTSDGYRLIHPDSPVYYKYCESSGPVPWNQQQCIVGGLLRLAQCHRLLNDGNTNIAYYEKITGDAAKWFFSNAKLVNVNGHNCYDWGYVRVDDPEDHREDTGHSFYDVYVLRAFEANLGPTRVQMQRLINTALFVINMGSNQFSGYVNGVTNQYREQRKYLNYEWIEMSVLDKRLYELTGTAAVGSHQYWNDLPVAAAVLYAKHFWATAPASATIEIVDNEKAAPVAKPSTHSKWKISAAALLGWLWCASEFGLTIFKRSKSNAMSKDRHSLGLIWLLTLSGVALGIFAAYRLHNCRIPYSDLTLKTAITLFLLGMVLRWWAIIHLGRFFTTNVAIANDHRVIADGPYHFIRHPSYTGSLLAVIGFGLSFHNWASLLIIFTASAAATLWRIHIEEAALAEALGTSYETYMARTKRLVPFVY